VTDKKFPGNPTRSYRSAAPVRVIRELTERTRLTPAALQTWRERLATIRDDETAQILN
jgi:rifampin ADP-ribosylating transferase